MQEYGLSCKVLSLICHSTFFVSLSALLSSQNIEPIEKNVISLLNVKCSVGHKSDFVFFLLAPWLHPTNETISVTDTYSGQSGQK